MTCRSVLNSQSTRGGGPTHLSVHPDGYLLTANYSSGSVVVHRLNDDGSIGESTDLVRHEGADREPHAHQVVTDPSGRWVLAVDLGADSVYVYGLADGKLTEHQQCGCRPVRGLGISRSTRTARWCTSWASCARRSPCAPGRTARSRPAR